MTTRIIVALALLLVTPLTSNAQSPVRIDGSTGTAPLIEALARAFEQQNPGASIRVGGGMNTRQRFEALRGNAIDIVMASHGLDVARLRSEGMPVLEIARTPVVFAVHSSVPVAVLSTEQLCGIYAGRLTNWRELGGPDLTIAARVRPDSEVDMEVARGGVGCLRSLPVAASIPVAQRAGDMARELAQTAGSIGMTTMTVVQQSGGRLRAIALDGVVPDPENVASGRYGLVRQTYLVTAGAPTGDVERFLSFVISREGAAVIRANGAIPIDDPRR